MRVHVLQHVLYEGPGHLETWALSRNHRIKTTRVFVEDSLPALEDLDLLVIMGGPMGVYEEARYPWLVPEKTLIRRAIENRKFVLGICLGAQLMAEALGASVYPHTEKEIGWFPIEMNAANVRLHPLNLLAPARTVFHWHGDTFDLPDGASHLARSASCMNQAFAFGERVLGLQFHLEVQPGQIEAMIDHGAHDLVPGPFVMDPREILAQASHRVPALHQSSDQILDQWVLHA